MSGAYDSPAARDLLGEPLVSILATDTVEEALAAALVALRERYGPRRLNRALKAALAKPRVGRPRRAGLEAREERFLMLIPQRPDGRPDIKGFVAQRHILEELGSQSPKAGEKQVQRLLRARTRRGQKPPI
jgi:hypothetical protein